MDWNIWNDYGTGPGMLLLAAAILLALSAVPRAASRSAIAELLGTGILLAGSVIGLIGAGIELFREKPATILSIPWSAMSCELRLVADPLSALFLFPVFLIAGLGAVYALGYWPARDHAERRTRVFYGPLAASMSLLICSGDAISFLISWELMALSAYFLILAEDEDRAVRRAGWLYLVATHFGTLCLFAMFALMHSVTGSFLFARIGAGVAATGAGTAIVLLGICGFGLKAGIMPLHVWLPPAHAAAPSHVSALMSGVLIKMGIYGLIRLLSLFPDQPAWWGWLLFALGLTSGVLGVAFALGQHDIKRLLAYHSVENIGIIVMGIGLAQVGKSTGNAAWFALGMAGALLHVLNHSLFKSLLFYAAGAVVHATGTREIDDLGGVMKKMPRTGGAFLIGAVAISGLPPLNGFISEWLIYLGLFRTVSEGGGAGWALGAAGVPGLALIGGLALACFVKVFGIVFLGEPRHGRAGHEAHATMVVPMLIIAALCVVIGVLPLSVSPLLERSMRAAAGGAIETPSLDGLAYLSHISLMAGVLTALIIATALLAKWRLRAAPRRAAPTWDCGYIAPTARMQYTASSFAQWLVDFFAWALVPRRRIPELRKPFPGPAHFHTSVPDTVLDRAIMPVSRGIARGLAHARWLQRNRVQAYLLYVLLTLIVLLFLV